MIATSFDESNFVLDKPPSMSYDECDPLAVWVGDSLEGNPLVISCWKLTVDELAEINRTGRIYLLVHGRGMPPVSLQVSNPFKPEDYHDNE